MKDLRTFYKGKRVFVTGHTGFKGAWMCKTLSILGADVTGYSLEPPTQPALYEMIGLDNEIESVIGDIRDLNYLIETVQRVKPEIVIHMAAQPIVRDSYENPVYTYETNVMGTVNIFEAIRNTPSVKSVVNVTTDKVYRNREWFWGYRECEELNGFDPYSNSKSCSELVTNCYINSFFSKDAFESIHDEQVAPPAISTCRAGNVIGGGDFANDRIIPDCVRAIQNNRNIIVRNPYSIRPYQHVLEPVVAYLMIAQAQYEDSSYADNYNVGPNETDCWTTGDIVSLFCDKYNLSTGASLEWINQHDGGPHEANFLKLDITKIKTVLGWTPVWSVDEAMSKIIEWNIEFLNDRDIKKCTENQIRQYLKTYSHVNM